MPSIPPPLVARLSSPEHQALERFLDVIGLTLDAVYAANVADHMELRGDDAQLFGLKVWKHEWYALDQELLDDPAIDVAAVNGTYEIHIGPLRIGVYALGHLASEDVHQCFPDSSPFKRGFGEDNQLRLFALDTLDTPRDPSCYALDSLTVGHFGNARDGLVKWYLGAWAVDELGHRRWSWVERQDHPGERVEPLPTRSATAPFSDRPLEAIELKPRKPA